MLLSSFNLNLPLLQMKMDALMAFPTSIPKLVLLDRDGVINHDVGAPGVTSLSQFRLTEGAADAIGRLKRSGCTVALVTNQSCVGKGIISRTQLDEIHDVMIEQLRTNDAEATLDRLYVCTSATEAEDDTRRKPRPGMMLEAIVDFGVDAADSVLIGDNLTDLQAASAAEVPLRILVATGYGAGIMGREASLTSDSAEYVTEVAPLSSFPESILPFYYVKNLASAVDFLMKR
jgi:D-glycero-D-manno-heptose 1,7-bisphosphate phosphatase